MNDSDLFQTPAISGNYTAKDIEVLEGLEPVRLRPGMYVGGIDDRAYHHLAAEILDNAMDEAVAGYANRIELELSENQHLTIRDNGRGIPTDPHPKFPLKSALEVILTTLHSGGKFTNKNYGISGGLNGVGISVVNALSDHLHVEIVRNKRLFTQTFSAGKPVTGLEDRGAVSRRSGTAVTFHPDPEIFGQDVRFNPARLYRMVRSKAYLYRGVEIRWKCAASLMEDEAPTEMIFHFPGGLADYLQDSMDTNNRIVENLFTGFSEFPESAGRVEWATGWHGVNDGLVRSYCNTIPTPDGGAHEAGVRSAIVRGLRAYGELINNRKAAQIQPDDALAGAHILLSVFIPDPQFVGQTKDKLATANASRLVETAVRDHFDHWLSCHSKAANALLTHAIERAEERQRRRQEREVNRKTATKRVRLPGKLADCSNNTAEGTELFLVEGDSAGGSAKQARNRATQAILPLRGKILNVACATADKIRANQEVQDMIQALGCGSGRSYDDNKLRYDRIIIMTDADVDGAHIASLLITFFYQQTPELIENGHLYLAQPPLYRTAAGGVVRYARDDAHKDELVASVFKGKKVEISRFKGLGEMPPAQLKETTMDPKNRVLLRVSIPDDQAQPTAKLVNGLMGRKPELRLAFIQENAGIAGDLDI